MGHEDSADLSETRVCRQRRDVAGELLDTIDLALALDLDRHRLAAFVATQQIDWAECGRVLAANECETRLDRLGQLGEQHLQVCLDAVLGEARVFAEFV